MLLFVAASVPLTWVEGTSPNDSYDHFKGFFFLKSDFCLCVHPQPCCDQACPLAERNIQGRDGEVLLDHPFDHLVCVVVSGYILKGGWRQCSRTGAWVGCSSINCISPGIMPCWSPLQLCALCVNHVALSRERNELSLLPE